MAQVGNVFSALWPLFAAVSFIFKFATLNCALFFCYNKIWIFFASFISGGFCKDQVYLEGALQLLKNRKRIDFHLLVQLGKISWEDIDKVELLGNLDESKVPFFMEDLTVYHKHLDRICEANGLTDDVLREV